MSSGKCQEKLGFIPWGTGSRKLRKGTGGGVEGKKHKYYTAFHLATLLARRKAKTRIRLRDWLKLAGEKIQ